MNIDEPRQAAGSAILALTDAFGFDAHAAGWLYDQPSDSWRYVLVTPMLRSKGPAWIYERLMRLFQQHPLPDGVSPLDIYVLDPDMELAMFGPIGLTDDESPGVPGLSVMTAHDLKFENFIVQDGFIAFQRRLPKTLRKGRRDPAPNFSRRIDQLQAA